eukprot:Hpha_TRINITY_DN36224_c0_g1::TRINITY_DN36224_c0_g1_i1::g.83260::m.83260
MRVRQQRPPAAPAPEGPPPPGAWVGNEWKHPTQPVQFGEKPGELTVLVGENKRMVEGMSGRVIYVHGIDHDTTFIDLKVKALMQLREQLTREEETGQPLDTLPLPLQRVLIIITDAGRVRSAAFPKGLEGTPLQGCFARVLDDADRLGMHGFPRDELLKIDLYSRVEWDDFLCGRMPAAGSDEETHLEGEDDWGSEAEDLDDESESGGEGEVDGGADVHSQPSPKLRSPHITSPKKQGDATHAEVRGGRGVARGRGSSARPTTRGGKGAGGGMGL